MIRLIIADDDVLVREGIVNLLALDKDIEVVGQAGNGDEAVQLANTTQPDLILMDIRMPKRDGIKATEAIVATHPQIKILALTTIDDDELVMKTLRAGAKGYLLKSTPYKQLVDAIKAVQHGHVLIDAGLAPHMVGKLPGAAPGGTGGADHNRLKQLSERQIEVFKLLGEGKTNEEMAEALCLSEGTVKNHVSKILEVLGARDRIQAALLSQKTQF
ncbi:MAG TPA: response regulator transcription factor [Candidatus Obscuribacterales bacterium]